MLNRVEMMSRQLETMSDQIEGALDDLQIEHGEGLIGTITPRSFRFGVPRVSFQIGCLTEDELNETISTALGVERAPWPVRGLLKQKLGSGSFTRPWTLWGIWQVIA